LIYTEALAKRGMITEADIQAAEMSLGNNNVKAPLAQEDIMVVAAPEEEQLVLRHCSDRPVFKLSVKLIDTYKNINKVAPASDSSPTNRINALFLGVL
jgi:hypothetical protein